MIVNFDTMWSGRWQVSTRTQIESKWKWHKMALYWVNEWERTTTIEVAFCFCFDCYWCDKSMGMLHSSGEKEHKCAHTIRWFAHVYPLDWASKFSFVVVISSSLFSIHSRTSHWKVQNAIYDWFTIGESYMWYSGIWQTKSTFSTFGQFINWSLVKIVYQFAGIIIANRLSREYNAFVFAISSDWSEFRRSNKNNRK